MAATATEGPVMSLINRRLRALRKKYNRITQMEESIFQGKTLNKDQEELLHSKPAVIVLIKELEKLHAPLSAAVSEEISRASSDQITSPKDLTEEMGSRDSISDLPDEILGKILSLLPTKLVVSTSVLSKRWRTLIYLVDNLDFAYPYLEKQPPFSGFMQDKFLNSVNPPRIKKFSLNCGYNNGNAELWIRTALERGCLDLHLQELCMCLTVFYTNTLVKLTLSDRFNLDLWKPFPDKDIVLFPTLKSLTLSGVRMNNNAIYGVFFANLPVLEELFIRDQYRYTAWQGKVESESIKRLSVSVNNPKPEELDYVFGFSFDAPSLVYLDCSYYVTCYYALNLPSLEEARLDIRIWDSTTIQDVLDSVNVLDDDYHVDVTDLVAAISNVKILHLSPNTLEVFYFCCNSMAVFNNLLRLSIESDKEKGWQVVPLLLKSSPNLQTLAIKGLVHKITNGCGDVCACIHNTRNELCCLSTCRVKVLEISRYVGTSKELKQMKYFLRNLKCLETVKIGLQLEKNNNYYFQVINDLMKLPKGPNCHIHFL